MHISEWPSLPHSDKQGIVFNVSQVWIWMWYCPNPANTCQIKLVCWVNQIQGELWMLASMGCYFILFFLVWVGLGCGVYGVLQGEGAGYTCKLFSVQVPSWTELKAVIWFWPVAAAISFSASISLFVVCHWF